MKKEYTKPQIKAVRINSCEHITDLKSGNYNAAQLLFNKEKSNVINY
ncbi:MAG: hypothetical protein LUC92_02045 [Clostridiales bacterium]|nr:hypothetical protein [Clostridiales bacterium]